MSYIPNRSGNYVNLKLTNIGRRQLTIGKLNFSKAVFSDREVNYSFLRNLQTEADRNRTFGERSIGENVIQNNRVLSPAADNPALPNINYDLSEAVLLEDGRLSTQVTTTTAMTPSIGFFQPLNTAATTIAGLEYKLDPDKYIISGITSTDFMSGNFTLDNNSPSDIVAGNLIHIRYQAKFSGMDYADSFSRENFSLPLASQMYRVGAIVTNAIYTDRDLSDYFTFFIGAGNVRLPFYTFPATSSAETFYGSATTSTADVWMMNIVRTSSVIGDASDTSYQSYGSLNFNGTKKYLGFEDTHRSIGIIHYTNQYNKDTYGDELVAGTAQLDMPHVLWHNHDAMAGKALTGGLRVTDGGQEVKYDFAAQTEYANLADERGYVVGRVYHKLKIFVITDPELLNALSYKANRNWTLPKPKLRLVDAPKEPLTLSNATPILNDGESLLVTYLTEADFVFNQAVADTSLGFGLQNLHCGYIEKIDCVGASKYVEMTFPDGGFPYLRNQAGFQTYSGTGWSANRVKMIAKKINTSDFTNINSVGESDWKSFGGDYGFSLSVLSNGMYRGANFGTVPVDPAVLQSRKFIVSDEDYTSATTYSLQDFYTDNNTSGTFPLNIGDQYFFFGNVQVGIAQNTYKTIMTIPMTFPDYNESANDTFKANRDDEAFVSEVGILNRNNELVAVGKLTNPVRKTDFRTLVFQLEMDF